MRVVLEEREGRKVRSRVVRLREGVAGDCKLDVCV